MTKRVLTCLLLFSVSLSLLFSAQGDNRQKIYPVDSELFEAITYLYVSEGFALPSTTGPWSEAELVFMLDRIDREKLDGSRATVYDYVHESLNQSAKIESKGVDFSWNFDAALEGYYHTNTDDFLGRDTWIRGFMDQKPLLGVSLETWPAGNFYGYSEFTVGNANHLAEVDDFGLGFGSTSLATNLIVLPPAGLNDLDFNMPYRAFGAAGGDHWSFQLGRDRMNWGAGTSGNLFLGDNLKYHNMARFTTFGEKFKYTFVTSFFPHSSAYMDVDDGGIDYSEDGPIFGDRQSAAIVGINLFMAHRLEWRMFRDTVGIALTESIMYQSKENTFDLRFLNPSMIYHNYYIRSNANSLIGLELDYTPIKGLNLYGQVVVDEFSLPGEPVASETESAYAAAWGYLAGVKSVFPVDRYMGYASFEFAYTDPFLYLRYETDNGATASSPDAYHLNHVGVIREYSTVSDQLMRYNAEFLGYKYGGDAIVINVNSGLKQLGKWHVDVNGFYMLHGTFDIYTAWSKIGKDTGVPHDISTPTETHYPQNYNDEDADDVRNSASHTLVIGASGSYQIVKGLKAYGQIDYINVNNYKNIEGNHTQDIQLTLGVSYSL